MIDEYMAGKIDMVITKSGIAGVWTYKFDDALFRRFVDIIEIQSMVEAAFLFKVGVEVTSTGFIVEVETTRFNSIKWN